MKTMALSREITLTIDNYNITLDKEIKIYEYDAINLCFTIQEYGIVMRDGKAHNRVMPIVALKAYMLIETPQGVDSVEATNIVRNKVIFSLGNKYSQFVGVGKMQIILRDLDGCRITLPEFNYEVKQSINTGWDMPDVLIGEKDFVITDELGRPVETTKISEMDEVNEVTPQTYTMVVNEDGNKKIKLDTIMESISETIEFDAEEIDRRIDEMIEVYDDEEIEVEFPSLHNDVERIKGEINEISESLDNMESEKASKLEVDVERKRIDCFTKLGEGSTTGDAELIDGRIGVGNKKYSNIGGAIRGQVSDISNELHEIENVIPNLESIIVDVNILDNAILYENAIYNDGAVGNKDSAIQNIEYNNTYGYCYDPIKIRDDNGNLLYEGLKANKVINQGVPVAFYFNQSGGYVKTIYGKTLYNLNNVYDIPENVYYIAFQQWYQTISNPSDFKVTYNKNKKIWIGNDKEINKDLIYHIGSGEYDGVTHFNGIIECFNAIKDIKEEKTVHVYEGNYDILAELGGMDYINSKNTSDHKWQDVQPTLDNIRIIGHGKVIFNFMLEKTDYSHYWLFSCLNLRGNHYVENIEIHSANCRYSIHDESDNAYPNTKHEYFNVRAYHNEKVIGQGQGQAYGSGYSKNSIGIFRDCYFTGVYDSWTCHANSNTKFFFDNCIIKSLKTDSQCALRISQNGQNKIYAKVNNCFIGNGLTIRNEWTDTTIKGDTEVELINTNIPYLTNGYDTVLSSITSYNTISGEVKTLLTVS